MDIQRNFGSRLGGQHPEIVDNTRKSQDLFTVIETFHVCVGKQPDKILNHELQFCPSRVQEYYESRSAHIEEATRKNNSVGERGCLLFHAIASIETCDVR